MNIEFTESQRRALTIAVIISLVFGAIFLKKYFTIIVTALIVSYLFAPVYNRLKKKVKKPTTAASLTLLISILAVVIPLTLIILITLKDATHWLDSASNLFSNTDAKQLSISINNYINQWLAKLPGNLHVNQQQLESSLQSIASTLATGIVNFLKGSIGGIASMITMVILYIYIFTAVLVHSSKLTAIAKGLNPMGDQVSELYLSNMKVMTKAMVRGQFIIATIQGLLSAAALYIVGIHYFAVFALILTILSFIPLGAGIVTIPIGIVLILMGDYWQGIFLILWHLIVVTNVDNVLRPRLVPKEARLNPALTMLAVFAGLSMFGFLGIVIGPVLMILIVSTIQVYLRANQEGAAAQPKQITKPKAA